MVTKKHRIPISFYQSIIYERRWIFLFLCRLLNNNIFLVDGAMHSAKQRGRHLWGTFFKIFLNLIKQTKTFYKLKKISKEPKWSGFFGTFAIQMLNLSQDYFETVDEATQCEKPEAKTVHVFRDPTGTGHRRPISAISW